MRACPVLAGLAAALAFSFPPAAAEDDRAIEAFLLEARVVSIEEIGTGITRPKRVVLELDGEQRKAAFKNVVVDYTQKTARVGNNVTMTFTDDFRYERAAFLLDRHLGMEMVPVAVLREIDGEKGALIDWVGGAINEMERRTQEIGPPEPDTLVRQRDVMKVFDLLIRNSDRNLSNQLITTDDWRLHLIDHSRSFRMEKKLPEGSEETPLSLPRWLYERLRGLEERELRELFGGLLGKARVRALLARRDRIVEKVDRDRERYGDAVVFHASPEEVAPVESAGGPGSPGGS